MDRLDEFAIFLAIVDAGSLGGAARKVRRSAASISRALSSLEDRLGAALIVRNTRRLTLTEAGARFTEAARRTLEAYSHTLDQHVDDTPSGVLRVTAPRVFGSRHVAPVLARFVQAYPSVTAELVLADHWLDLADEGIDVALRIGKGDHTRMPSYRIGQVRHVVVATPDYLSAHGQPCNPEDLAQHMIVHIAAGTSLSEWRFRSGPNERVVRLSPRLAVNDIPAALAVVRAGQAIARPLSYQVAEELGAGVFVRLLRAYEAPPIPVRLLTASQQPPARVQAFVEFAVPVLSALPVVQPEPRES
jgi:DNA-binding transcriptional LysR family regulator